MNKSVSRALRTYNPLVPNKYQLVDAWRTIYATNIPHEDIKPIDGILGVVVDRASVKKHILSVDMCEIVRETHKAFAAALGYDNTYIGPTIWRYDGHGILEGADQPKLTWMLINERQVEPVADIDKIRAILEEIHKNALVVANTSTGPGTEIATIEFLSHYLPGCFDGILFPRNYDATSTTTKGHALQDMMHTLSIDPKQTRICHVDDAPHHNLHVMRVMKEHGVKHVMSTMPLFEAGKNVRECQSVTIPAGVNTAETTVGALTSSAHFLTGEPILAAA